MMAFVLTSPLEINAYHYQNIGGNKNLIQNTSYMSTTKTDLPNSSPKY